MGNFIADLLLTMLGMMSTGFIVMIIDRFRRLGKISSDKFLDSVYFIALGSFIFYSIVLLIVCLNYLAL